MAWSDKSRMETVTTPWSRVVQVGQSHRGWRNAIIVLILLLVVWASRSVWLPGMGQLLMRDDHPNRGAAAIVLLMGSTWDRARHAADLYQEGYASKIIFVKNENTPLMAEGITPNEADATQILLHRWQIPDTAVAYQNTTAVTSTKEEVQALLDYLPQVVPEHSSLIVVTSWYHTSRAAWAWQRIGGNRYQVAWSPAITPKSGPDNWWQHEESFLMVFNEYLKWLYYLGKSM